MDLSYPWGFLGEFWFLGTVRNLFEGFELDAGYVFSSIFRHVVNPLGRFDRSNALLRTTLFFKFFKSVFKGMGLDDQ